MSKSILSKVAAVACSVASVIALGVCASAEKLEITKDNYSDLKDGVVNIVATKVELEEKDIPADKIVDYTVEIKGNTGFAPAGVRLVYDKALKVVPNEDDEPGTAGDVAASISPYITENAEAYNVSIGTMGMKNSKNDGVFFSVKFKLPDDAKAGKEYPMKIEVDKFLDKDNNQVANNTVAGYIKILGDAVVTTTTAPVTTTVTTTTTAPITTVTTSTTKPVTTTAPVTTTVPVTTTAPITTSASGSSASTTSTTSGATASAKTTTSTAKGGNGGTKTTKAGATQTGDTGAGVAVAALMLAAGTAVVAAKKKED